MSVTLLHQNSKFERSPVSGFEMPALGIPQKDPRHFRLNRISFRPDLFTQEGPGLVGQGDSIDDRILQTRKKTIVFIKSGSIEPNTNRNKRVKE
jgi:hypothetical protein